MSIARGGVGTLLVMALSWQIVGPARAQPAAEIRPGMAARAQARHVAGVTTIGMTVADLDSQVRFFVDVLDFEKVAETEAWGEPTERATGVFGARCRAARLRLGEECIELTQFVAPAGRPVPPDSRSNDRWFQHIAIVVSDMDAAYARLRAAKVRHVSPAPQTLPGWNPAAGGISAFYFSDPEGHVLEVIHFPRGKGDPRWQVPAERLFLGIDHTAIVVEDTQRSLEFYGDGLGMTIAGRSENYGPEQDRLNSVFGARLLITTLRAQHGPGVELLEYVSPSDGRDYPRDARACDRFHWQTTMVAPDLREFEGHFREAGTVWISPGVVPGPDGGSVCTIRDPDGHAIRLVTEPAAGMSGSASR